MLRVEYIKDMKLEHGSRARIGGRVVKVNDLKSARFVWIRDITGSAQVTILKNSMEPELLKIAEQLMPNDFVIIEGTVPKEIKTSLGKELLPTKIEIVSRTSGPSPIDIEGINESSVDKRLSWRALDLRNQKNTAVFLVQSKLMEGMQRYLYSQKFMQTFTPSLMGASSEGGSEVFQLKHFGKNAFLRQDPQLHRQLLMVAGFERVYEIGPSWRAELSNTPMHLTEHRTCAAEMSYIESEKDVMELEEGLVKSAMKTVSDECKEELALFEADIRIPEHFPVLEFPGVYDILEELGFKPKRGEEDYNKQGEAALGKYVKERYNSDFFFVNRFPYAIKPFYVMRFDDEPQWARSVDLMYKGLEISSGGQREHRYEKIIEQAKGKGLNVDNLKWFSEFFKYGAPPHGGFSIGIERLTMKILGIQNIREAVLFPRTPDLLVP